MQKANPTRTPGRRHIKYDERPDWMKRWEATGLLKFEDKNGDGVIQYYNDKTKNAGLPGQGRGCRLEGQRTG